MNSFNNGRIIATTSLLLLVASMITPAAFAGSNDVVSTRSVGNTAVPEAIEKGVCGQVDLMFVIDDTGSMAGALENVKANLPAIINQANLADVDNARIGLITFKDDVTVLHDLSATQADVVTSIGNLFADAGSANPEAVDEAKNTAINNLLGGPRNDIKGVEGLQIGDNVAAWQADGPNTANIMVIITDDQSAGFSDSNTNEADYASNMGALGTAALGKGIHVSDVYVGADEANTVAVNAMKADAANSAGKYIFTARGIDTATAITDIIADCANFNPPSTVAGELLAIDSTSLFISGLFTNSFWMLPAMAGIAGTGAFVIRSRMHKDQEN